MEDVPDAIKCSIQSLPAPPRGQALPGLRCCGGPGGGLARRDTAAQVYAAHVEAPSAWDSNSVLLVLIETLLAAVQALTRDETRARMTRLEALYERSRNLRRR